jgi:hypothetical protein
MRRKEDEEATPYEDTVAGETEDEKAAREKRNEGKTKPEV